MPRTTFKSLSRNTMTQQTCTSVSEQCVPTGCDVAINPEAPTLQQLEWELYRIMTARIAMGLSRRSLQQHATRSRARAPKQCQNRQDNVLVLEAQEMELEAQNTIAGNKAKALPSPGSQ